MTIHEAYADYAAPPWVRRTVEGLLAGIAMRPSNPASVVLTNSAAIGAGRTMRRRGKKYRRKECLGFYHPATRGAEAWIELVVDNTIARWPSPLLWFNLFRDLAVARVLFHELGHHLNATVGAPAASGERAAEAWRYRLSRNYMRRRYWCLRPLTPAVRPLVTWMRRRRQRRDPE